MPAILPSTLLERNKKYAETHQAFPTIEDVLKSGGIFETTLVVTCVDFRVNPDAFLQTKPTDQVLVSRNPAGRVVPHTLEQVMLFDAFLGLEQILVIHHTDCGASYFKDEEIRKVHKNRLPHHDEIDHMVFGAFENLEQSVRDDLGIIKISPYVSEKLKDNTFGFVYDIATGLLTPVKFEN